MGLFSIGKMIMRSLVNKPATLMYPVIPRVYSEKTRGHIAIDIETCILCGICVKKCPTNALEVDRKGKEWSIARMQCIQCNCCVEACPVKCLTMKNTYSPSATEKVRNSFVKAPEAPKTAPATPIQAEAPVEAAAPTEA
jgi:ech hydrogenase subunit F